MMQSLSGGRALARAARILAAAAFLAMAARPALATLDYNLAPGDVVEFDFLDDDELPRQLTVSADGKIQVPLLGAVVVAGVPVGDAQKLLERQFVDRKFLHDPRLSLSVVNFRPIFVLGDVRNPGSFPFKPLLTVEQAIGLAGGPSVAGARADESPVAASKIRGEIAGIDADIVREAIVSARLSALLGGRTTIEVADLPESTRPYIRNFEPLRAVASDYLAAENQQFAKQKQILGENIAETSREMALLEEQIVNQAKTIKFSREDAERTSALLKNGLTRASEMSRVERQLTSDEGRMLSLQTQVSQLRRSIGELKRDLAQLEDQRRKEALLSLQDQTIKLDKLFALRRASEDQLLVTANFSAEALRSGQSVIDFKIRRRVNDKIESMAVDNLADVLPGDVVMAVIRRPEPTTLGAVVRPVAENGVKVP
ncbi:polysaccharide biosynthesis/export family protein [Prosthecomicrobium sp. N25]|uniref:polysaccharide biosynthesis/export family protein n=1 Tax=Prosthecomicrobium sp. N25 TaxID=3129254 RepID=UPI003077063C